MSRRVCALALFAVMLPGGRLTAAPPEQRRPAQPAEAVVEEFIPQAGYLREVQRLRLLRAAMEAGRFGLAPGVNLSIRGTRSIPVLCVEFSNRPHKFDVAEHQRVLFDPPGAPPSPPRPTLTQYYRDISNGVFVPNGEVLGWFRMPRDDAFYEGGNNGLGERMGDLLQSTFDQADAVADFGQFDNDGPDGLPNSGDDDGVVDTVFVVHPETGGECDTSNIWSHSFQYSEFGASGGSPYATNDVRKDELGQPVLGPNGTAQHILIDDYTVQPGLACGSSSALPQIIPIGVFCHEYGHALGLPDLYDRTPSGGADSAGVGNYCLMAGGSYGADGVHAATPVHMSAWCKALMGWAQIEPIDATTPVALEPVQQRNLVYNVDVPGTDGKEFFLIEYRDSTWSMPGRINWDADFNPGGLAIWHVDEHVGAASPNWPFAPADQGQNDSASRPNPAGTGFRPKHALVALIQADRQQHLETGSNRFDGGDLFGTGDDFSDDPQFRAGSRGYDGSKTDIAVTDVNLATGQAVVAVNDGNNAPPAAGPPEIAARNVARAGNGTVIELAPRVQPDEVEVLKSLRSIDRKLAEGGTENLGEQDRETLAATPVGQLRQGISAERRADALKISADARTMEVKASSPAETAAAKAVTNLLAGSEKSAVVRFSPNEKRVERITGLEVASEMPMTDDSGRLTDEKLQALVGPGVVLKRDEAASTDGMIRFSQVVEADGKQIPLSCNGVKFYFKDGTLTAVESNVIPPDALTVSGSPEALSVEDAKGVVTERLGVDASLIDDATQCVYLVGGDRDRGRAAVRVDLKSGGHRPDLEVFVDAETSQILAVQ
ncbi:MAG: M6 family metalloprotease domain-containing protein [Planctomycetaceae bacterium]